MIRMQTPHIGQPSMSPSFCASQRSRKAEVQARQAQRVHDPTNWWCSVSRRRHSHQGEAVGVGPAAGRTWCFPHRATTVGASRQAPDAPAVKVSSTSWNTPRVAASLAHVPESIGAPSISRALPTTRPVLVSGLFRVKSVCRPVVLRPAPGPGDFRVRGLEPRRLRAAWVGVPVGAQQSIGAPSIARARSLEARGSAR